MAFRIKFKKDSNSKNALPASSDIKVDKKMKKKLTSLDINQETIEYILNNHERIIGQTAHSLTLKFKLSCEKAEQVLEIIKSSNQTALTKDEIEKIEVCLKDTEVENAQSIAFIADINENLVTDYLESKPLSESQRVEVIKLVNKGQSTDEITRKHTLLSKKKVRALVRDYLQQYSLNPAEDNYASLQKKQIEEIILSVGKEIKTFHIYRTIVTESFENLINRAKEVGNKPMEAFNILLPLIFYYLKCSLSFQEIAGIISKKGKLTFTAYDIFHIIFQLSDPVVRGLCIEHYSFSNPIPLYYPNIHTSLCQKGKIEFNFCSELWYSIQEYNGLISFGLGRASWSPIGKSTLLNLIFDTDFAQKDLQKGAFHLQSIDIQMSRNLFGKVRDEGNESMTDKAKKESTKWAYIDCHRYSDPNVIQAICQRLNIALIHISYSDYKSNHQLVTAEISRFHKNLKHIYVFIRDCEESHVVINQRSDSETYIFVPNLTIEDSTVNSELKTIGFEILHLKIDNPKLIDAEFMESVMSYLKCRNLEEVRKDKKLIQTIMRYGKGHPTATEEIDYSFLSNYYPSFVKYMSCYYLTSCETNQMAIDELNLQRFNLKEELEHINMGDVVLSFNAILERSNSGLILWKLSQELSTLTNQVLLRNKENINEKFSIEILWREALLTSKYGTKMKCQKNRDKYIEKFACNFGNHVERGETFELIDGDNLRFFNKDINILLLQLYNKQFDELSTINFGKTLCIRQAPIVISIFGPQSSGKSTLLNYCFGCKFLTSAGRCTRGIYGSLAKLSQHVNRTNQFLILDTEGLDGGGKRENSLIHFDRTMVLFCLAVSQVVIINVIGDLGEKMQNLLQICGYSLHKLRVSKVVTPKIFFVLNQQADPDPSKHVDSMNNLLNKLEESDLRGLEGCKISELIQVSERNLFVLPSAFNSKQMNQTSSKLFNSNVIKLIPTDVFANECAILRQAILNQLINMPLEERTPFKTMDEWLEMSGVIWETIIKYQDIVKYRNVDELKSNHLLEQIVDELMEKHFRAISHREEFDRIITQSISEIQRIEKLEVPQIILSENMSNFDDKFKEYRKQCFEEFEKRCQDEKLLQRMDYVCEEMRLNLMRILYIERKKFEDKLKPHVKAVLNEIKLAENKGRFQKAINENVDSCLNLNNREQTEAFEEIWTKWFGGNERKEEEDERNEDFDNLYTIFKMESKTMENKQTILERFRKLNFDMEAIIRKLQSEMQSTFERESHTFSATEDFIFPWKENNVPIKNMIPYIGKVEYEYLGKDTLFRVKSRESTETPIISNWVPKCCHSLVVYCSGYSNHADITWETEERKQILLLASRLKDPKDVRKGTWEKLLENLSSSIKEFIERDPDISQGTVKQLVNFLHNTFKHVNYEINYIQAKLTIAAETNITTLVFALAFKSKWEMKTKKKLERKKGNDEIKSEILKSFLEKVDSRIKAIRNWDRKELKMSDKRLSNHFALDFLEGVKRWIMADEFNIDLKLTDTMSYENILFQIEDLISKELSSEPGKEIINQNNFVIQFICNRNDTIKEVFHRKWEDLVEELYHDIFQRMNNKLLNKLIQIKAVLTTLVQDLETNSSKLGKSNVFGFDSDTIFEVDEDVLERDHNFQLKIRKCILKSLVLYLQMYLDPSVTQVCFSEFFNNTFEVDGIKMKKTQSSCLILDKLTDPTAILDADTFKKLTNTQMFNSEQIFNIYEYTREFLFVVNSYQFILSRIEFEEMVKPLKEKFESLVINCPSECPSCGKLCERELHPHSGKCRIRTGHQICSMGGKVWKNDENRTAILLMCDDYKDHTKVQLPKSEVNWAKFKEQTENQWDWSLPNDEVYLPLQQNNREKMKNIWDKFGRGILDYHANKGVNIKYIPYSTFENALKESQSAKYCVCFVIDGTGSMGTDIQKARVSVKQLISIYEARGNPAVFKIVIYRDHCDGKKIIEEFPTNSDFTENYSSIIQFLEELEVYGGGDGPEAVVDGLATATSKCNWTSSKGVKNIIIHIFDAPPHGNFPDYRSHNSNSNKANCCCCNHGIMCTFDWKKDVWDIIHNFNIEYHGISTGGRFIQFEDAMKTNLGNLCGNFQEVGKESVNEAIVEIFIDY